MDYSNLRTVKQLAGELKWATEGMLRDWIFRDRDGFKVVLVRIGGRLFIDLIEFNKWLESQRLVTRNASQVA